MVSVLPIVGQYDFDSPLRSVSCRAMEGKEMDFSLLKLPAAALGSILFRLQFPTALTCPMHSCSHQPHFLPERVSVIVSESKIKMINYTYLNVVKVLF